MIMNGTPTIPNKYRSGQFWKELSKELVALTGGYGAPLSILPVLGKHLPVARGMYVVVPEGCVQEVPGMFTRKQVQTFCWEMRKHPTLVSPHGVIWGYRRGGLCFFGSGFLTTHLMGDVEPSSIVLTVEG